ncbi:hypothetical protein AD953_01320 [Acetobacter malorum]|uniref:Uncharacterized protein n=2 Tax=Acetobacter malorum TaxID=178901 RepID=A0A149VHQ5_9PROT|nr:hypothetical protein AD953_01320 [Acetobacter malorum]
MNLPGSLHSVPQDTKCGMHHNRDAVANIQGETDSFGAEYILMCQECYDEYKEEAKKPHISTCDWCKAKHVTVRPRRDYDEGMSGPVYYVCQNCIDKDNARIADELADDDLSYDCGDWE